VAREVELVEECENSAVEKRDSLLGVPIQLKSQRADCGAGQNTASHKQSLFRVMEQLDMLQAERDLR
jgi:hypothetical protein